MAVAGSCAEDTPAMGPGSGPVPRQLAISRVSAEATAGSASTASGYELPNFTDQEIADYLRSGYWTQDGGVTHQFNLGATGIHAKDGEIRVKFDGWTRDADGVTDAGKELAWQALQLYANVLNVTFVEVEGDGVTADLYFGDSETDAYARSRYNVSTGNIEYSWVNIGTAWIATYGTGIGSYSLQTYIHEIGHALGLGHAGPYEGFATFVTNASDVTTNTNVYLNDSWQKSVMSYMDQTENTTLDASYARLLTPMAADWIALADMPSYEIADAYSDDTTYGFNTTITAETSAIWAALADRADRNAFHIIDTAGNDTVDFSGFADAQVIDLAGGSVSDIGGLVGNMTIGAETVIENAVGGGGGDWLKGNAADNILVGNDGDDRLDGFDGADTLFGGAGADLLEGGEGDDALHGGGGEDQVRGGPGRDTLHSAGEGSYYGGPDDDIVYAGPTGAGQVETLYGGDGIDLLDTTEFGGAYTIDLATGLTSFASESFLEFEWLRTGAGADTLVGDASDNAIWGNDGNDWIRGAEGNDSLYGGAGNDTLEGGDGDDTLAGHQGADVLVGGSGINRVFGGGGGDRIHSGGAGLYKGGNGDDIIHAGPTDPSAGETLLGGAGIDRLNTESHDGDYTINLETGATSFANERFSGFEDLFSGPGNDMLTGTAGANRIWGNAGNDTIEGGAGDDALDGGAGNDNLFGGDGADILLGGAGADWLEGGEGADTIEGGDGNDRIWGGVYDTVRGGRGDDRILSGGAGAFYGDAGDDILYADAGTGAEMLDGGEGVDRLDTTQALVDYVIDLGAAGSQSGFAEEAFHGFEHVTTGSGADRITGSRADNVIHAGAGDDAVDGGRGRDWLYGEAGADVLLGGFGADRLDGGQGNDHLDAGMGADELHGGAGNDTYRIHETRQKIFEAADGGRDLVLSSASYDLSAQGQDIENMQLLDDADISGTGNDRDNKITGNDGANLLAGLGGDDLLIGRRGNDTLDGGTGDDVMRGARGNDTYVVDSAGDRVIEGGRHGSNDAIHATISLDLEAAAPNVEVLVLKGDGNIDGFGTGRKNLLKGNAGDNILEGRNGQDVLDGGAGNDVLTGGKSADTFILNAGDGVDTITDLNLDRDVIRFDSGADGFADLTIAQDGTDTRIGYGSGDSVLLLAIDARDLATDMFVF
ncbi:M10 family metallopeptidase C-terminal domain-containing protein [Tropicimonas aquimaris]|uniref:M10 family metallopeptidase C-terminal domain-containing protein n=1 Tax=Tropicimonas aquimaris TaxID=914152 RepID=A0ABW3IKA7_9RHOB